MNESEMLLIKKYREGTLSRDEWNALEEAIADGSIELSSLSLDAIQNGIENIKEENTPTGIRQNVMDLISNERSTETKTIKLNREWIIRGLMTAAAMLTGLIIGYMVPAKSTIANDDVAKLRTEMQSLKESMMLTLLAKDEVTDRLKAVSYTYDLDQSSKKVIDALISALNEDTNINVRLAAVDALQHYAQEPSVREQLIKSISIQESPLVQIALAECMVNLKEKKSIDELQKIINNKLTPDPIKNRLKGCIQQII